MSEDQQRREKLKALRARGNPFPNDFRRDAFAADLLAAYADKADAIKTDPPRAKVAGRMMSKRVMGKAGFADLRDMSGKLQLFLQRDNLPDGVYEEWKQFDIGDIIAAEGELFFTKTGELSLRVTALRLLTKSLRPLPEKFHGLSDAELRYRQRYVDLIMNAASREVFVKRMQIIRKLREFLCAQSFMEVETPMMHPIAGGAAARPFITHHNALNTKFYLRVAPELYLKRLVVGGFERVFEINRNFRNEGVSTKHNPEFTMLEFYQAYADYHDFIDLTENMMRDVCQAVIGGLTFEYQGAQIDFAAPFARMTMLESILHHNPDLNAKQLQDRDALAALLESRGVAVEVAHGLGKLQTALFEQSVEDKLIAPVFITAYPIEVSPLSRRNDTEPELSDRFELFAGGREIANGFSELNDAEDQAARFKQQVDRGHLGDLEAMHYDADYIRALEYAMPPTAGCGVGIDRLVMLLTDSASIRDVLLFPHMRGEANTK